MDTLIKAAIDYVKDFFKNDSSGHDYFHTLRVYRLAQTIASQYEVDETIISLAALLHDVDDVKLSNETSKNKSNAIGFMKLHNVDNKIIEEVISIINEVSFKGTDSVVPKTLEGKIVQDADRLDAIGAIGIARAFAYGGSRNRVMYDPDEAPKLKMKEDEYFNHVSTTINHFYEKLLLLKDMMNTDVAKKMAESRHQFMENYLKEFYSEWDGLL